MKTSICGHYNNVWITVVNNSGNKIRIKKKETVTGKSNELYQRNRQIDHLDLTKSDKIANLNPGYFMKKQIEKNYRICQSEDETKLKMK